MDNDNLDIRLKAIEYAVGRISVAICDGRSPAEFTQEIKSLVSLLSSGHLDPENEAIVRQTVMILDPLGGDPWEPRLPYQTASLANHPGIHMPGRLLRGRPACSLLMSKI